MEAENSAAAQRADQVSAAGPDQDAGADADAAGTPGASAGAAADGGNQPEPEPQTERGTEADAVHEREAEAQAEYEAEAAREGEAADDTESEHEAGADLAPESAERGRRPVTSGIGCAALLLPLIAVLGAILCFAAGLLSTVTGCTPNGSALCSANGAWFTFALPLFVSPIIAAATAIGAVTVRRHRSSWLAVGYGVVFISVIVGLASASTGSS